jgi:hypothetical protein
LADQQAVLQPSAQRKVVLLTLSRAGELSFRALKLPQRQG